MTKLILDTSVIIENLRTGEGIFWEILASAGLSELEVYLPAPVWTELWAGAFTAQNEISKEFTYLVSLFKFVPTSPEIAKRAGELERDGFVGGNDAVIASAALELNAELATLNRKHFQRVVGLKLY